MFSRKEHLLLKTGPDGIGRYDYLRLLKKEINETNSADAREQILANLANFAYDPINYDYIRSLDLINLFLKELNSTNVNFINFAAAAICNLSSDPINCQHIIRQNGFEIICNVLCNKNEEILLNVITSLLFIRTNISVEESNRIFTSSFVNKIRNLQESSSSIRVRNLITLFVERQDVA